MTKQERKNIRILLIIVSTLLFFLMIDMVISNCIDSDTLWEIATGRDILQNGITYINPFTVDKNLSFTIQAWLFDVLIAIADNMGLIGIYCFALINTGLLVIISYYYLSQYKISWFTKFIICTILCVVFSDLYTVKLRPENITLILLLIECIALEKYKNENKIKWLILLPITTLLEANFHCSMLIFHFAIVLAYIFPSINKYIYTNTESSYKNILLFTILSAITMFINPYGLDAVLYLFNSLRSNAFIYITIVEMMKPAILSRVTVIIICIIALLFILYKTKTLQSHQVYLALGFSFCSLLAMRNVMFLYIAVLVLLAPLCQYINEDEIIFSKSLSNWIILLSIIMLCVCSGHAGYRFLAGKDMTMKDYISEQGGTLKDLDEINEYICNDSKKPVEEIKLFTDFNFGGYFEYLGYKNIFIDARPEIYTKEMTKGKDIFDVYVYLIYGNVPDKDVEFDINDILYEYDFDYIITEENSTKYLNGYLDNPNETDYKFVDEWGLYRLYKKV